MCYSAMQAQAAKNKFFDFGFKTRVQVDYDERMIYPLQPMAFGRLQPGTGERESLVGQFGLVPPWVTEEKGGTKFGRYCYNARSESIFEKPSFRHEILHQRAVIPVTTFFEFPDNEKPLKHRYRVSRKDLKSFWFAALWAHNERFKVDSCTIITSTPMALVKKFHSRSPVILDDDQLEAWLDPMIGGREPIAAFLKPHSSTNFVLDQEDWKPAPRKKKEPQVTIAN